MGAGGRPEVNSPGKVVKRSLDCIECSANLSWMMEYLRQVGPPGKFDSRVGPHPRGHNLNQELRPPVQS